MTSEGRHRNAKRLAMAIQRRGGIWYLTEDHSRFLLLNFWAHARLRRRLGALQPELLAELQRVAITNGTGCATAGKPLEPSKPERRLSVN